MNEIEKNVEKKEWIDIGDLKPTVINNVSGRRIMAHRKRSNKNIQLWKVYTNLEIKKT